MVLANHFEHVLKSRKVSYVGDFVVAASSAAASAATAAGVVGGVAVADGVVAGVVAVLVGVVAAVAVFVDVGVLVVALLSLPAPAASCLKLPLCARRDRVLCGGVLPVGLLGALSPPPPPPPPLWPASLGCGNTRSTVHE